MNYIKGNAMKQHPFSLGLAVFVAALFVMSCSQTVDSLGDETLRIIAKNNAVELTNTSEVVVHYVLIESETANLVDLIPNVYEWPSIEPGEKISIPYSEISGYNATAKKAWITWSTGETDSGNDLTIKL
jgi:hypothetical protein